MPDHVYHKGCKNQCGYCVLCCLACCKLCHAYEGGLTTECPGESYDTDAVYLGERDFFDGQWHEGHASKHSPEHYRRNSKKDHEAIAEAQANL